MRHLSFRAVFVRTFEVPCGIFDDPKLVADVNEAVATIKKARTGGGGVCKQL